MADLYKKYVKNSDSKPNLKNKYVKNESNIQEELRNRILDWNKKSNTYITQARARYFGATGTMDSSDPKGLLRNYKVDMNSWEADKAPKTSPSYTGPQFSNSGKYEGGFKQDASEWYTKMHAEKSFLDTEAQAINDFIRDNDKYISGDVKSAWSKLYSASQENQNSALSTAKLESNLFGEYETEEDFIKGYEKFLYDDKVKTAHLQKEENILTVMNLDLDDYNRLRKKRDEARIKKDDAVYLRERFKKENYPDIMISGKTQEEINDIKRQIKEQREQREADFKPYDDAVAKAEAEIADIQRQIEEFEKTRLHVYGGSYDGLLEALKSQEGLVKDIKNYQDLYELEHIYELEDYQKYSDIGKGMTDYSLSLWNEDELEGYSTTAARDFEDIYIYIREKGMPLQDEINNWLPFAPGITDHAQDIEDIALGMTQKEYDAYAYYAGKGDEEKKKLIIDTVRNRLIMEEAQEKYEFWGGDDASTLVQVANRFSSEFGSFFDNVKYNFTSYYPMESEARDVATAQVHSDLKDKDHGMLSSVVGGIGNQLPSIVASMIVTAATGNPTVGSLVGNVSMGVSASGSAYRQAIEMGYDEWDARSYGALVGGSELAIGSLLSGVASMGGSLTSKGISALTDSIDDVILKAGTSKIGRIAAQTAKIAVEHGGRMASEFGEEYLQAVLEPWYQNILLGTDNSINPFSKEVLEAGLVGALSAGVINASQSVATLGVNTGAKAINNYRTGKQLKADGIDVTDIGKMFSADTVAYKIANKVDENTGAYTIGKLFNEVNATMSEQNKAEIIDTLVNKGVLRADAEILVDSIETSMALGEDNFSANERYILDNNPALNEAVREVLVDKNTTLYQRISRTVELNKQLTEKALQKVANKFAKGESVSDEEIDSFAEETDLSVDAMNAENITASVDEASTESTPNSVKAESKTYNTIDNAEEAVSPVEKIVSTKDGKVKYQTKDGETVDASEAVFRNEDEAVIYETALDMGLPAAVINYAVNEYDSNTASALEYIYGVRTAYEYGASGIHQSYISSDALSALSHKQRQDAYELGKAIAQDEVATRQKAIGDKVSKSNNAKMRKGTVQMDGKEYNVDTVEGLTEVQKESVRASKFLAEVLGNDINLYNSYIATEGKYKGRRVYKKANGEVALAPNGFYNPDGSINIDINAGSNGEGIILETLGHELTHHIRAWSPAKFKVMADFLFDQYYKHGVDVQGLIHEQIAKAKRNGRTISYDTAYEEVVADAFSRMLTDTDAISKLAKTDKGLYNKVKAWVKGIVNKINKLYSRYDPQSKEAQYAKKMNDVASELQRLWLEGLEDATNNYKSVDSSQLSKTGETKYSYSSIAYSFFGDENVKNVKIEDFENGSFTKTEGYKNYVSSCLNNTRQTMGKEFNESEARNEIEDSIKGIVKVAVEMKKAGYDILDNHEKRGAKDSKKRLLFSSLEPNSDYFTSSDISTICDKRINFASIYDEIVRREAKLGVPKGKRFFDNVDNYFVIHKIMAEKGLTQPCRQCYVESMRKNLAPMANAFLKLMQETNPNNKSNDQLYHVKGKQKGEIKSNNAELRSKLLEAITAEEYDITADKLTVEMLTTEDGLTQLKLQAPLIYEAFNSFYGQSKPKMPKSATPFRFGELTAMLTDNNGKIKTGTVNKIIATGGFRLQSYSDFQIQNFVDVLQVIFEAGTLGLNGHAYTKVPAFLEATKDTNLKRNISIFMYNDNGRWLLDKNDSFPYELEEIYDIVNSDKKGNTSIVAVVQNEKMAAWVMANDNIGFFIPFHKSGLKMGTVRDTIVKEGGRKIKGYSDIKDHTRQQTEVWAKTTADHKALTKVKKGINIYSEEVGWDFDNIENLPKNKLIEKNIKAYIDACERAGYLPKFREYVMNNTKVLNSVLNYSKELGFVSQDATIDDISFNYKGYQIPYGYYKCLGDFGMFTPEGKASPIERLTLKNYNFEEAVKFFSDAETLRRTEILQQIANGSERVRYLYGDKKNMTTAEIAEEIQSKRNEVVDEVVSGEHKDDSKQSDKREAKAENQILHSDRDIAPTFYSYMGKVVDEIKPAKMGAGGVVSYLKGKGVKNEEIKWSGIETFLEGKKSVTKQELQEFVAGSQLQIEEEEKYQSAALENFLVEWRKIIDYDYEQEGDLAVDDDFILNTTEFLQNAVDEGNLEQSEMDKLLSLAEKAKDEHPNAMPTKWEDYKLDGGKNYRELLFKMPNENYTNREMKAHWGNVAKGIIAHARIQDFDVNGKRMLFVEEIQSDWHNKGHKEGYVDKTKGATTKTTTVKHEDSAVPDAPFRDNYHEYVMKRLLRIAAEEGYDSIGWTTAETQSKRWSDEYAEGYRIEYDQDIPKFLRKYGKKWGATVGSERINGNEVWSMDITDSMRNSVLHEGQTMYSDRDTDGGFSQRSLLANALESTAESDQDKKTLAQYKKNIAMLSETQDRLENVKAKIKELSFGKGKRDSEQLANLKRTAKELTDLINRYDKKLFSLESTDSLKRVLEVERKRAFAKATEEGRNNLQAYKDKMIQREQNIRDNYQESKARAIEKRSKTEMKNKIKKLVGKLDSLLRNQTKEKHIPIYYQKSVAQMLEILNLDEQLRVARAEKRMTATEEKYTRLLEEEKAKENPDAELIEFYQQKLDKNTNTVGKVSEAIQSIKDAYHEITSSNDPIYVNNPEVENLLDGYRQYIGDTQLSDMTLKQLDYVYNSFKIVDYMISEANKGHKLNRSKTISDYSEEFAGEIRESHKTKTRTLSSIKIGKSEIRVPHLLSNFKWDYKKPWFAIRSLGSKVANELYDNLRKGEDTWAVDIQNATKKFEELAEKYDIQKWNFDKKIKCGNVDITLDQLLSLYAYSKREAADKHLAEGGFVFDSSVKLRKGKKGIFEYQITMPEPQTVSKTDMVELMSNLTDDMKAWADEMQDYLSSDLSAIGNEVSRELYGINLFNEKHYFPIKVMQEVLDFNAEKHTDIVPNITNMGMTKPVLPNANNTIVLGGFTDIWARHCNDMAKYHAFALAMDDFTKVYNYGKGAQSFGKSVKVAIKNAKGLGDAANKYIQTFLQDVNGGVRADEMQGIDALISKFKKSSVMASASVVIQQPSAIGRAFGMINPKYFVKTDMNINHAKTVAEMEKYAPIAIIKRLGGFDTNTSGKTSDIILGKDNEGVIKKANNALGYLPQKADELTWCAIWNACKREAKHKYNLEGEELLKKAGERFTEVIQVTQVYDSVFSRNAMMRSKSKFNKMVTAFMAEPITTMNDAVYAVQQMRQGNKKAGTSMLLGGLTSLVINSVLSSIVYAWRDDDEDETYAEKFISSAVGETVEGLNPITYLPILKDIYSLAQGYDVERTDMALVSDVIDKVGNIITAYSNREDDMTDEELAEAQKEIEQAWIDAGFEVLNIFGIPADNLRREIVGIAQTVTRDNDYETTWSTVMEAISEKIRDAKPFGRLTDDESKSDKIYQAIAEGDTEMLKRLKDSYKTEKAYESAMRQGLRDNDERIKAAAKAGYEGNERERVRICKEIIAEGLYSQDMVVKAVNAEINKLAKDEPEEEKEDTPEYESDVIYKASDINDAIEYGDIEGAYEIIGELVEDKKNKYLFEAEQKGERLTEREAEKKAKSSLKSTLTSHWKDIYIEAYKSGDDEECKRIRQILGNSELWDRKSEVSELCRNWLKEARKK